MIRIFFLSNIIPNLGIHYNKFTADAYELLIINNAFIIQFDKESELNNNDITAIPLETFSTKDVVDSHINGKLTVIWRDWDDILKSHPKMVYISHVNPHEIKGPHLHTKRDSYFVCIRGKVVFIIKDNAENFHEIESSEEKPILVHIPKNVASAHINLSDETSTILTLANPAWRQNDDEMKNVIFDDYDWKKWKKN